MTGLNQLTASELRQGIRQGDFSAVEIARDVISRIEEREPLIHAWQYFSPEMVLEQAEILDAGESTGALHGVPLGIKDIMDTHDMPTAYGSAIYEGHRPADDAAVTALLRRAGAMLIGKTVTTELAYFQPGPTVNPTDPVCTPGGSSSGSAAAVADRMVPVGFGTQTAGSLTRPASYCGIIGYKPSYGVHSLAGVKPLSPSLDTLGWMARSVADLALVRDALLGDSSTEILKDSIQPPTIGICRTWEWSAADTDSRAALDFAKSCVSAEGARISEVELPELYSPAVDAQKIIMAFEAAQSLADEWGRHRQHLSDAILALVEDGMACSPDDYLSARKFADECRRQIAAVFGDCDVLLTPSAIGEPPEGLSPTGDPLFARLWTLLHLPTVSVPGYHGSNGRPVGVQLIGRPYRDEDLLRVADWCHRRMTG